MTATAIKTLRILYSRTVTSIAFIPAVVAVFFLVLSFFMIQFDFSETGKTIKANANWLKLKDASTARSIISTITGGLISLTVFSFSMVMILLNQAASQMSNRILNNLIGNRFQQTILGFYIGTIIYALFLLSTIRDIDSGIYVPAISTYLLITFTVIDIFLFIYFLHYVTQSVKYDTIIHKIYDKTLKSLKNTCLLKEKSVAFNLSEAKTLVNAYKSGIYQGFQKEGLVTFCVEENILIYFLYPMGTAVIEGVPVLAIQGDIKLTDTLKNELAGLINIHGGQDIMTNSYFGFRQLMEVAVRALSPGINDSGTAILSLQSLGRLLSFCISNYPDTQIRDEKDIIRIVTQEWTFDEIFQDSIYPIWDYGREDRMLINELKHTLLQLQQIKSSPKITDLLAKIESLKNFDPALMA